MPDGLYERDVLAWSEQQAALLRRVAAGERLSEAVDWDNVIEEVQELGRSELHTVESLLEQAVQHLVKLRLCADSQSLPHWRGETVSFLASARRRFSPSMRQKLDLDDIYDTALQTVREMYPRSDTKGLPIASPWNLEQLLARNPDLDALTLCLHVVSPSRPVGI